MDKVLIDEIDCLMENVKGKIRGQKNTGNWIVELMYLKKVIDV